MNRQVAKSAKNLGWVEPRPELDELARRFGATLFRHGIKPVVQPR